MNRTESSFTFQSAPSYTFLTYSKFLISREVLLMIRLQNVQLGTFITGRFLLHCTERPTLSIVVKDGRKREEKIEMTPGRRRRVKAFPRAAAAYGRQQKK